MMKNNFLSKVILFFAVVLVTIYGCNSNKSKQQEIVGEWKAYWKTAPDDQLSEINEENLKMNGVINFMEDGKVEISAFGYEGCIFSSDTLKNILSWKMDDSVLRFMDSGDEQGLPYTINKFTSNEVQLTLLQDISLTLQRN
jgi:hypothetical protein